MLEIRNIHSLITLFTIMHENSHSLLI